MYGNSIRNDSKGGCVGGWQNDWKRKGWSIEMQNGEAGGRGIARSIRRTQWESNPGDLWNPHRYEPTIAIHMDKLIQDGVLYTDDGTTIRNETPRFENVNLIWIAGKLSQCLSYERDDLSVLSSLTPIIDPLSCIHMHTSRKSSPFPFSRPS